jgi:hypothetical protein
MGSEYKEVTGAHFHGLDLRRGSAKRTAQPKDITIDVDEPFHIT